MTDPLRWEVRADGIAVLTIDHPGRPVNLLGQSLLKELLKVAEELRARQGLRGLLVRSGKPGQFLAGADLREVAALEGKTREEIAAFTDLGRAAFAAIGSLPFPTVGLIHGPCLGGGLELALALDDRIALDDDRTKLGAPEVSLGLIPTWGGTQRLTRRIGLPALDLLASGEPIGASQAATLGLVYDAVPPDELESQGVARLAELRAGDAWRELRSRWAGRLEIGPRAIEAAVRQTVSRWKIREGSAAWHALEAARNGARLDLAAGLEVEKAYALKRFGTPEASNRIALFFLRTRAAKEAGLPAGVGFSPVQRVGILGAGQMGAGIAAAMARSGLSTVLVDVDEERIAQGLARINLEETRRARTGRAGPQELANLVSRIETQTTPSALVGCDLVIEAIPEEESLKKRVFEELGHTLPADVILGSNTSSISIEKLAEFVPDATRFLGIHFFHPVERMELVEIIRSPSTSDCTTATAVELTRRIGKVPVVVNDGPGFLVSRVLFPYLNEGLILVEEGAHLDEVDAAAVEFGMPMGPIALADLIGLDTVASAAHLLAHAFPDRAVGAPLLDAMIAEGRLGRKSGVGFWRYEGPRGQPSPDPTLIPLLSRYRTGDRSPTSDEICRRLFFPMLLEAVRCLEDGIARDPGDIDLALVLGIGFPADRGGLLRWCDREGAGRIVHQLERYRGLGGRFLPCETLVRLAQQGGKFFPPSA